MVGDHCSAEIFQFVLLQIVREYHHFHSSRNFLSPCLLVSEALITAMCVSVDARDYACPILAPVYPDLHLRAGRYRCHGLFIPLPRNTTRSSSRSQSPYMVFIFIHSLRSLNANWDFHRSNRTIGDDRRKLLGKHIWKEFLLNPSEEEKGCVSGVFYCVYQTIREVKKEGKCERIVKRACEEPSSRFLRLEENRL